MSTESNYRHVVLWKHMFKWETRGRKTNSHTGVTWGQDLVLFYKQSHLSNVFRDTTSRKTGHFLLKGGANSASGWKEIPPQETEEAPLPPPWLHNGWPRNVLSPSSGKEAFLPVALSFDTCYFSWAWGFRFGTDDIRWGRKRWEVRWEQQAFAHCFMSTSMPMATFTLWWQGWMVVTENVWLAKPKVLSIWPFQEKVCLPVGAAQCLTVEL